MDDLIRKYVGDLEWIRDKLSVMDDDLNPVMGICDWDDAVCIKFNGKLVASTDGPYNKRLVMKSALIHAATDVVVKGARPLFALDNIIGSKDDAKGMIDSLREQALRMNIPLIGGNTLFEDVEARCCITVVGELMLDEPIRDSTACKGDVICLIGEPIWGEIGERIEKAKLLFETWFNALGKVKFNSSKDVTKGGLVSVAYEMEEKSGHKFKLGEIPYSMTRNLDNFIVTLTEYEYVSLEKICAKHGCKLTRIGTVE